MRIEDNIQESIYCFGHKIRVWVGMNISSEMESVHGGSEFVRFSGQKLAYKKKHFEKRINDLSFTSTKTKYIKTKN